MKSLAAVNKYFVKYKWHFIIGAIFVIGSNLFAVIAPEIIKNVIDKVYGQIKIYQSTSDPIYKSKISSEIMTFVTKQGLLLVLFAVIRGILMFCMRQTLIVMSRHIEYDQKLEIFNQYQKLDMAFFKTHSTGDLMSRMAEDVSRVRMYTGPAVMYLINLSSVIVMCLYGMISVNAKLTFFVLIPLPILTIVIFNMNKIIHKKSSKIQAQLSGLTASAQEAYSGIRVIKSFVQEENVFKKFTANSEIYRDSNINLSKTESIFFPSMSFFVGLSMLLIISIGGYMAMHGEISGGNIAQFIAYINLLMFPFSALGMTASMIQRAAASQNRINEFLDTKPAIEDEHDAVELKEYNSIEFKNVSFTYPDTGVVALKNFNLKVNPGEKIAIMGKTGSGKSTILHLLLRMYDVDEGEILINGINIKNIKRHIYRNEVSYVPQEVFLFSDTISHNISFGLEKASQDSIELAAKNAAIHDEILDLENQYNTVVGERGVMLSGGQKQRVSIARALIKDPQMFIMDDSLSAVDTKTEHRIVDNFKTYLQGRTTFVVTHRIFQGWHFDKIIMLDEGQIVEEGNHDSLMDKDGVYAQMFNYQILGISES